MADLATRLRCWLFGHRWEGTWKRDRLDRDGETAEWCPRCQRLRSLVDDEAYCGQFPLGEARDRGRERSC